MEKELSSITKSEYSESIIQSIINLISTEAEEELAKDFDEDILLDKIMSRFEQERNYAITQLNRANDTEELEGFTSLHNLIINYNINELDETDVREYIAIYIKGYF